MLYRCFVDFKKAYDSVWRDTLLNMIHKIGIKGQFLQILKSIYSTKTNSLIYHKFFSPKFIINVGVKQGDPLTTILFNLYINDLPNIFEGEDNYPISIIIIMIIV